MNRQLAQLKKTIQSREMLGKRDILNRRKYNHLLLQGGVKRKRSSVERDIYLSFHLKGRSEGGWYEYHGGDWFLRWRSDSGDETLHAMHKFHDKLSAYGWIMDTTLGNYSKMGDDATIPGKVRKWNGVMEWKLEIPAIWGGENSDHPEHLDPENLKRSFSQRLQELKDLMSGLLYDVRTGSGTGSIVLNSERWRYAVVHGEDRYPNDPKDWQRESGKEGEREEFLSGKILKYQMTDF